MMRNGNFHHNARLTDEDLDDIRRRRKAGERPIDLANEYGVSAGHIVNLCNGNKRKDYTRSETMAGIAQIPDDVNLVLKLGGNPTPEQELRADAAIALACQQIRDRLDGQPRDIITERHGPAGGRKTQIVFATKRGGTYSL